MKGCRDRSGEGSIISGQYRRDVGDRNRSGCDWAGHGQDAVVFDSQGDRSRAGAIVPSDRWGLQCRFDLEIGTIKIKIPFVRKGLANVRILPTTVQRQGDTFGGVVGTARLRHRWTVHHVSPSNRVRFDVNSTLGIGNAAGFDAKPYKSFGLRLQSHIELPVTKIYQPGGGCIQKCEVIDREARYRFRKVDRGDEGAIAGRGWFSGA